MFVFLLIFISQFNVEARPPSILTPFQKNIQSCLQDGVDLKKVTTLAKIYSYISQKYFLISSEVMAREVSYKLKDESRKLKYENGKVQLFKVSDDEDERLIPVNNEVRQRSLTTEAYLTQLLLRADIRSDWMKMSEKRSGSTRVSVTTVDGEIKSLQIERAGLKKRLECTRSEDVEGCTCSDIN